MMKKLFLCCSLPALLCACTSSETKVKGSRSDSTTAQTATSLPYTAAYSGQWTNDVSDADLNTVLQSYKDWETNNMNGLANALADSVEVDMANGDHFKKSRADLMKLWSTNRDSMSTVKIKMDAWNKMYAPDKKEGYIVAWYDETDTYKTGKVDSASYHDINQVKNGKIVWYAQYKRPKK